MQIFAGSNGSSSLNDLSPPTWPQQTVLTLAPPPSAATRPQTQRALTGLLGAFPRTPSAPDPPSTACIAASSTAAHAPASPGSPAGPHPPPACACRKHAAAYADAHPPPAPGSAQSASRYVRHFAS